MMNITIANDFAGEILNVCLIFDSGQWYHTGPLITWSYGIDGIAELARKWDLVCKAD